MREWHAEYQDQGLVIIGNHYPEFRYEHDLENLKAAVDELGIDKNRVSPVVLPDYIPDHVKAKQLSTKYQGTII